MGDMDWVDKLKRQVLDAGGGFIRTSASGHMIYRLGRHQLSFPNHKNHGWGSRHKDNLTHQVKVALAEAAKVAATAPKVVDRSPGLTAAEVEQMVATTVVERPVAAASPAPVAEPTRRKNPNACRWCDKTFRRWPGRASHERHEHAAEYAAAGGTNRDKATARRHRIMTLVGPLQCPWCEETAEDPRGLGVHATRVHPADFKKLRASGKRVVDLILEKTPVEPMVPPPAAPALLPPTTAPLDATNVLRAFDLEIARLRDQILTELQGRVELEREIARLRTVNAKLRTAIAPFAAALKGLEGLAE